MTQLIYQQESYQIIGKCLEVHRILGPGFLEVIYKDALEYEFQLAGVPYIREQPFLVPYKDTVLPRKYNADFTVFGTILLEAKALSELNDVILCKAINYLKVSRLELCLLVNFGVPKLEIKRVVLQSQSRVSVTDHISFQGL